MNIYNAMKGLFKALWSRAFDNSAPWWRRRGNGYTKAALRESTPAYMRNARTMNRLAWCRAFNRANNFIVPQKSAGSMYDRFSRRAGVLEESL